MEETIFDGIVTNENSFTELFKNFLRFKTFRDSFIELIKIDIDLKVIDHEDFDTQLTISKFGRPDLVLTTHDTEILFEIKVCDTALTINQPKGYYNYLKEESKADKKGLILIAPENYYNFGRYEVNRLEVYNTADNIHHQIIHWETILELITKGELQKDSHLFNEYSNFMVDWFQLRPVFYDKINASTMFDKKIPEGLQKTMDIIDDQFRVFTNLGYEVKWSNYKGFTEYGFYFQMPDGEDQLFFGLWFDYWLKTAKPVCITIFSESEVINKAFSSGAVAANLEPPIPFEKWLVTSFNKEILMEEESVKSISILIRKIISVIGLSQREDKIIHDPQN